MFDGTYGSYVLMAYAFAAVVLAILIWTTLSASRRARRELAAMDRKRQGR